MAPDSSDIRFPRGAWLIGPAFLAAIALGVVLVRADLRDLFMWATGICLSAALLWVIVSALWPVKVDRTCPDCGKLTVIRLDPQSTRGLRCTACDYRDETASAFYIAEEEGPVEEAVLRDRGARAKRTPAERPGAEQAPAQRTADPKTLQHTR